MLEERDKALYETYFESNSDYYIKQLECFNEKGRCTFNVPAFFVGIFWMAYRKMYVHILVIFVIIYAEITIEDTLLNLDVISLNTYEILNYISMFVWSALFGFLSNKLYILKSKKDISKILMKKSNNDDIKKLLAKKGGTNQFAPLILLVILIIIMFSGF